MVAVQHLIGPASFPSIASCQLSILSYNVLLPNSQDGWWNYKMYSPPLRSGAGGISTWEHRQKLLEERLRAVNADVVCFQEVSPVSFETDFAFMEPILGYDGQVMFRKGRFRPATFWKTDKYRLKAEPVHKDRTLLTALECIEDGTVWYILNCHLQAGNEAPRRLRQIHEGMRAVRTLANNIEKNSIDKAPVIVCGDFNGGDECAAVRYLETGFIDEHFIEDTKSVTSGKKELPLSSPMKDTAREVEGREPPPTMVVNELISLLVDGGPFAEPYFQQDIINRLTRIYIRYGNSEPWTVPVVEKWLVAINGQVGRGSEFREAAKRMGWTEEDAETRPDGKPQVTLPSEGTLSLEDFIQVYLSELRQGKFWGIHYDLAVLGEPLSIPGIFTSRYDRIFHSAMVDTVAVMDFMCEKSCPHETEPSDHLPVAAAFRVRGHL